MQANPMLKDSRMQLGALTVLDYLSALFTCAERETFSRTEVLVVLNAVRTDPSLIDPDAVIAFEIATAHIDGGAQ